MAKKPDLSKLSVAALKTLGKDIDKAIAAAEKAQRKTALAEVEKAAQKHGFSLSELVDGKGKRGPKKAPAAPKYRHPENPAVTWSGRGRQPAWFKDAVKKGTSPEQLTI